MYITQKDKAYALSFCVAEREGFEPPESCPSTGFKTAAFDRSAISPKNIQFVKPIEENRYTV